MSEDFTLSAEQENMVRALLDEVIPPSRDGRLPGAGGLGLVEHVARTVRQTPMLRPVVEYGLTAIAEQAASRHPDGWGALSRDQRSELLLTFAAGDQFFLPAFLFLAYSGYYQHARVVEALGLEARAPHPEGYAMEPFDLTLLDAVRRRGKMYRDA